MDQVFIQQDLRKKKGSFSQGDEIHFKKMENKKNRSAFFVCSLSYKQPKKKQLLWLEKFMAEFLLKF